MAQEFLKAMSISFNSAFYYLQLHIHSDPTHRHRQGFKVQTFVEFMVYSIDLHCIHSLPCEEMLLGTYKSNGHPKLLR
jgi:hypothetical protein